MNGNRNFGMGVKTQADCDNAFRGLMSGKSRQQKPHNFGRQPRRQFKPRQHNEKQPQHITQGQEDKGLRNEVTALRQDIQASREELHAARNEVFELKNEMILVSNGLVKINEVLDYLAQEDEQEDEVDGTTNPAAGETPAIVN